MARPPVLGYNHDIKYGGIVYHVQTEDAGAPNNHITTHIFHKGAIIGTRRLDYTQEIEGLDNEQEVEKIIKSQMKEQHKGMIRDLLHGEFDDMIRSILAIDPKTGKKLEGEAAQQQAQQVAKAEENLELNTVVEKVGRAHYIDGDKEISGGQDVDKVVEKVENQLSKKEEEERLPSSISSAFSLMKSEGMWHEEGTFGESEIERSIRALAEEKGGAVQEERPKRYNIDAIIIEYLQNVQPK